MELYQVETNAEKLLQKKADKKKIPLGGGLELLPLCNMNCKMCYVRKSKEEMDAQGHLLNCDEWLSILDDAIREGLLFLTLTGGEPLIYPEFKRLYTSLVERGVILSVNTNATLIDEEWADFFARYGCRKLSITLYGKDDKTYHKLCGNPNGFSQVMNACNLLKERKVPFRLTSSITPTNVEQMPDLFAIANKLDVPLSVATYMFPAERRGKSVDEQFRLTAKDAAKAMIQRYHLEYPNIDLVEAAKQTLTELFYPPQSYTGKGFSCHAGHSGFWMTWKGDLLPCGMFDYPQISLLEHSFKDCWKYIVDICQELSFCKECKTCKIQNICHVCPASCYTETGHLTGCPDYVCQITKEEIRILEEIIKRKDTN